MRYFFIQQCVQKFHSLPMQ